MWYRLFKLLSIVLVKGLFRFKVEGLGNLPEKTNFIVVANHTSYLDPFLVGVAVRRRVYWIAQRDLYKVPLIYWFMKKTSSLPVGRAAEPLTELLRQNKNVGLFPEGRRTHDGKLTEFRRGAALLALKTGRPIVPCAITGAYQAFPVGAFFPKFFGEITVRIGKPQFLLQEFEETVDDVYLQEGTVRIQNAVKEMIYAG